jgi:hypothetical protein
LFDGNRIKRLQEGINEQPEILVKNPPVENNTYKAMKETQQKVDDCQMK